MGLVSFIAAVLSIHFDRFLNSANLHSKIELFFSGDAPTAVSILSVLISSTATIVSLILSMTMVTFTLTSAQYGPRLLRNFISDRTSQSFIGFFISVFVYSITILTHINSSQSSFFVPKFSVTFAIFMSITSILVLMFFVNHIAESLRVESIVSSVGKELMDVMQRVFCSKNFKESTDHQTQDLQFNFEVSTVKSGYIQNINFKQLSKLATEKDCIFKLHSRPGHYIYEREVFLSSTETLSEEEVKSILQNIEIGIFKTSSQDVEYTIDQLVEIALVALSPGVNKTFTAIACLDRLCEAIAFASHWNLTSKFYEIDDKLALIKYPIEFSDFIKACLDKIRQFSNLTTSIHIINSLTIIIRMTKDIDRRNYLSEYCKLTYESVDQSLLHAKDISDLESSYKQSQIILSA
jgi:uncharacterized membrane protein